MKRLLSLLVVILSMLLVGCGNEPNQTSTPQAGTSGGPSWSDLLFAAQAEVNKIDSAAALSSVISHATGTGLRCPSEYTFTFLQASGREIDINVTDAKLPSVTSVTEDTSTTPPSDQNIARLHAALSHIKLAPDEVCARALSEGIGYQEGPEIKLYLDLELKANPNSDPRWSAWFLEGPKGIKMTWFSQTGEIVDKKYIDVTPPSTVSP